MQFGYSLNTKTSSLYSDKAPLVHSHVNIERIISGDSIRRVQLDSDGKTRFWSSDDNGTTWENYEVICGLHMDNVILPDKTLKAGEYGSLGTSCDKEKYAPVGVIGFDVNSVAEVSVASVFVSGTNVSMCVRNNSANDVTLTGVACRVLYTKN